jgi:DNA invertase Pin-like site-specific DNA recombinase
MAASRLPAFKNSPAIARLRTAGEGIALGRKPLEETNAAKVKAIRAMRAQGKGIRRIAADLGVGVGTVLRITGPFAAVAVE